jgi:hypothetical protein
LLGGLGGFLQVESGTCAQAFLISTSSLYAQLGRILGLLHLIGALNWLSGCLSIDWPANNGG